MGYVQILNMHAQTSIQPGHASVQTSMIAIILNTAGQLLYQRMSASAF